MERKLNLVAAGQANKDEVVRDILKEMGDIFADLQSKKGSFVNNIAKYLKEDVFVGGGGGVGNNINGEPM